MGMFTNLFKKSFNPYEIPGARWYTATIASDASIVSSDIDLTHVTASGGVHYYFLPVGYRVIDVKYLYKGSATAAGNMTIGIRFEVDGNQGLMLSSTLARLTPDIEVYFLAVRS